MLPVTSMHRVVRVSLLVALLALPAAVAQAQFTNEVAVVRDGVRFFVRPSVTINTTANGVVQVQLTQIHARVDESYGIVVDGVRESYTEWNRGLVAGFNAIRVTSLSLGITFDGVQGCSGRVGYATWREGGQETLGCNTGSRARLTGFTVNGLSTSGLLELQSEVRRRRREQQAAQQTAQQSAQQSAQPAARQAATAPVPTSAVTNTSTVSSGAASTSPAAPSAPAPTTAAEAERAREQAEANRQAAAAQAALDQLTRDNAAARQRLDAATDELAGSVVAVAQIFAQNSRDKKEREAQRSAASAAAYQRAVAANAARIASRYAANLNGRLCTFDEVTLAPIGSVLKDSLTMQTCRTGDGRAMAWVQVLNTTPRHLRVTAGGNTEFGVLPIAHAPVSEWRDGSTAGKAKTYDFFLAPGAPAHRMLVWTNERGEIGQYSVRAREWTVSAVDKAFWYTGLDVSSSANTVGGYAQSLYGLRFDIGYHLGSRVLLGTHAGLDGENYNFGLNAHYVLGNDNQRLRPFIRLDPWTAVYGTTTYGFSNDIGYQGFVYGFGAGVLFFPSLTENNLAISLEWGTTSGSMFDDNATDQAYSQSGFRLGYRVFGFAAPR